MARAPVTKHEVQSVSICPEPSRSSHNTLFLAIDASSLPQLYPNLQPQHSRAVEEQPQYNITTFSTNNAVQWQAPLHEVLSLTVFPEKVHGGREDGRKTQPEDPDTSANALGKVLQRLRRRWCPPELMKDIAVLLQARQILVVFGLLGPCQRPFVPLSNALPLVKRGKETALQIRALFLALLFTEGAGRSRTSRSRS